MSLIAQTWFRALRIGMSPVEKLIGGELAYRAEDDTHHAWPMIARLAHDTEVPRRTVIRTLQSLEERGIIQRVGIHHRTKAVIYQLAVVLKVEAIPPQGCQPAKTDECQNGTDDGAKVAQMPDANLAHINSQEYKLTIQPHEPPPPAAAARQEAVEIPDWLPNEVWEAFKDHRRKMRKPMTAYAEKLIVKALERFRAAGHDPVVIVEQSISRGWLDVFEPKDRPPPTAPVGTDPWGGMAWWERHGQGATGKNHETGQQEPTVNGWLWLPMVEDVCNAARIRDTERPNLDALAGWLRDDLDPAADHVLRGIRAAAEGMGHIRSLGALEGTVRSLARALAGQ
jgi:hypothetical protein